MPASRQDITKLRGYAAVILLCLCALALSLFNGLHRGHWFTLGILVNLAVCATMIRLYLSEKRKPKATQLSGS